MQVASLFRESAPLLGAASMMEPTTTTTTTATTTTTTTAAITTTSAVLPASPATVAGATTLPSSPSVPISSSTTLPPSSTAASPASTSSPTSPNNDGCCSSLVQPEPQPQSQPSPLTSSLPPFEAQSPPQLLQQQQQQQQQDQLRSFAVDPVNDDDDANHDEHDTDTVESIQFSNKNTTEPITITSNPETIVNASLSTSSLPSPRSSSPLSSPSSTPPPTMSPSSSPLSVVVASSKITNATATTAATDPLINNNNNNMENDHHTSKMAVDFVEEDARSRSPRSPLTPPFPPPSQHNFPKEDIEEEGGEEEELITEPSSPIELDLIDDSYSKCKEKTSPVVNSPCLHDHLNNDDDDDDDDVDMNDISEPLNNINNNNINNNNNNNNNNNDEDYDGNDSNPEIERYNDTRINDIVVGCDRNNENDAGCSVASPSTTNKSISLIDCKEDNQIEEHKKQERHRNQEQHHNLYQQQHNQEQPPQHQLQHNHQHHQDHQDHHHHHHHHHHRNIINDDETNNPEHINKMETLCDCLSTNTTTINEDPGTPDNNNTVVPLGLRAINSPSDQQSFNATANHVPMDIMGEQLDHHHHHHHHHQHQQQQQQHDLHHQIHDGQHEDYSPETLQQQQQQEQLHLQQQQHSRQLQRHGHHLLQSDCNNGQQNNQHHHHQQQLHCEQQQQQQQQQQQHQQQQHNQEQQQQHVHHHHHHQHHQMHDRNHLTPNEQEQRHQLQIGQHEQQQDQQQHHQMQQNHYHHHQQFHQQSQQQQQMQMQQQQQQHHHHHPSHPLTCIDDLMIDDNHEDPSSRYKLLSPNVKHESQDDGYETSAGDVLTPSSHASSHSMTPQHQLHSNVILPKCEIPPPPQSAVDDPYNFIDDELNSSIQMMSSPSSGGSLSMRPQGYPHHPTGPSGSVSSILGTANGNQLMQLGRQLLGGPGPGISIGGIPTNLGLSPDMIGPKKRGRKKKIREENGALANGILKPIAHKERKKHDRFNGMPEEEVSKRTLPDHLANNLDIIIIGINPGLFAAYKGHHYAGPGNHFWKCLYLSGLTREQMTAEEDYKLLEFGIGFTNMVERATKGSADLTRKEIKEGCRTLLDKLRKFRPKIAVFNGKLIFEVFSGKKDFNFGRQPECIEGTNTYMWVMPSSSARCAQLPRAADKVPFYAALKKFRDYLNGLIPHIDESECVFTDPKYKQCCEPESQTDNLGGYSEITDISNCSLTNASATMATSTSSGSSIGGGGGGPLSSALVGGIQNCINLGDNELLQSGKKKRGRPKKIKGLDGSDPTGGGKINARRLMAAVGGVSDGCNSNNNGLNLNDLNSCSGIDIPKKKRGRPKKIKTSDLLSGSTTSSSNGMSGIISSGLLNGSGNNNNNNNGMTNGLEAINNSDLNHNSPNGGGGMNNLCGSLTQQQQQRLFSPPMHSPSTVSSYCPLGMNVSTPPINSNNGNHNNNNNNNNNGYHHPHTHHHQMGGTSQHHHSAAAGTHHSSPYHQTSQQQQPTPQQYTPHSDLSSEISAAISSDHLGESPTPTSPSLGPPDFDPPGSMQTDDTNPNDMRFSSPASTISEQQPGSHLGNHISAGYPTYRNPGSNNSYLSASGGSSSNDGHGSDSYMQPISNQSTVQQQQQQQSTQQQQQQSQQQTTNSNNVAQQSMQQISDVASKSLSGLESLVDQIPTMSDNDGTSTPNHLSSSSTNSDARLCGGGGGTSSSSSTGGGGGPGPGSNNDPNDQYTNNCLYASYANSMQLSCSSSPSATSNSSSMLSPHYTNASFSTSNPNVVATNCTTSNTSNTYGSLSSNFSVSSLTSSNYPTNSYHTNLMAAAAAATSPHHLGGGGSGGSPMYMEPHMPLPVNPLYHHHPYTQHSGYGGYSPVGVGPPPTIHMPSPNYPYGYGNTGSYAQPGHHPSHPAAAAAAAAAAGYLSNHPSVFDRIKPDIGYGGF